MTINKQQIEHLAKLARLKINKEEAQQLQTQIANILDFVSKLKQVDTSGVEPSFYGAPANNLLRADEVIDCQEADEIRKAMPDTKDDLLRTPKIFS